MPLGKSSMVYFKLNDARVDLEVDSFAGLILVMETPYEPEIR